MADVEIYRKRPCDGHYLFRSSSLCGQTSKRKYANRRCRSYGKHLQLWQFSHQSALAADVDRFCRSLCGSFSDRGREVRLGVAGGLRLHLGLEMDHSWCVGYSMRSEEHTSELQSPDHLV